MERTYKWLLSMFCLIGRKWFGVKGLLRLDRTAYFYCWFQS